MTIFMLVKQEEAVPSSKGIQITLMVIPVRSVIFGLIICNKTTYTEIKSYLMKYQFKNTFNCLSYTSADLKFERKEHQASEGIP